MIAKYGLPEQVLFCKRCVMSNQRPNSVREFDHVATSKKETIHFDAEGVCDACRVAEAKASTDWGAREVELLALCDHHRSTTGAWDCLVPGSGGKDSFYAAHILKTRYGMHPLTCTWAPHLYTDWGFRNHQRWLGSGFTNLLYFPDPRVHRLITRLAVDNLFHPFQPFIIGQKAMAPKLAALHGIPLVFYGENEAEYGNARATHSTSVRADSFHAQTGTKLYLGGVSTDELRSKHGLSDADLAPYEPASAEQLARAQVDVRYLGYYLKWHPQSAYYYAVEHGGFEAAPERTPGTYSKYNSIDDKMDDLHYYTTYIKFGIGRATYDAAQEIRSGDITRDEGVALVNRFDGEWPSRFESELWDYLSVPGFDALTKERFIEMAERFKSPHLWEGDRLKWQVS